MNFTLYFPPHYSGSLKESISNEMRFSKLSGLLLTPSPLFSRLVLTAKKGKVEPVKGTRRDGSALQSVAAARRGQLSRHLRLFGTQRQTCHPPRGSRSVQVGEKVPPHTHTLGLQHRADTAAVTCTTMKPQRRAAGNSQK